MVKHSVYFSLFLAVILSSCERITFKEYALKDYDGQLEWVLETDHAEWSKRYDHAATVFNNKLWVVGGYNSGVVQGDPYYEDVWSSSDGKSWELVVDDAPWLGRRGHQIVAFNDGSEEALYIIGGFTVDENSGERWYKNDVWRSTDGKNWTEIKSNNVVDQNSVSDWMARMHHRCEVAVHNGTSYIYLIGGMGMQSDVQGRYAMKYFHDVWRSTDGIQWERLSNTNYGIRAEHASAVGANGKLYIQGGLHGIIYEPEGSSSQPVDDYHFIWSSTDGITWIKENNASQIETSLMHRSGHSMVYYDDRLWALPGKTIGVDHYQFANDQYYPTWTFDTQQNWAIDSRGTAIDARHSYEALVFNNKIWVLGGFTNRHAQSNDVWSATLK